MNNMNNMNNMNKKIYIIGLGAGSIDALTLQAYRLLQQGYPLYLRTERHPVIDLLKQEQITYSSFDYIYDRASNFDEVYAQIVDKLIEYAHSSETAIIYAVPGHPMVAERSVKQVRAKAAEQQINIEMVSSSSFLDDMFSTLDVDPNEGFILLDGLDFNQTLLDSRMHTIITQVYSQDVASEVKLILMDYYPENTIATVIRAAGVKDMEQKWQLPIYELDRIKEIDHLTAIYIPKGTQTEQYKSFGKLVEIVGQLRAPDGCPWDQEQTHESLRGYLIEETYEVLDAIDAGDMDNLAEELGDILLHIIMHALIAYEEGEFSIYDVIENISQKMVRRHPHVFTDMNVDSVTQVLDNWEDIKRQEKQDKLAKDDKHLDDDKPKSILHGIPRGLPMLMYAYKQQKKAAKVGFDWDDEQPVWDKIQEELLELKAASNHSQQTDELGDLLYAVVNLARFMDINPELALRNTCQKFERRFQYIEQAVIDNGLTFDDVDLDWMERHWQAAKKL